MQAVIMSRNIEDWEQQWKTLEELMNCGADMTVITNSGHNVLDLAVSFGNWELAERLANFGLTFSRPHSRMPALISSLSKKLILWVL